MYIHTFFLLLPEWLNELGIWIS